MAETVPVQLSIRKSVDLAYHPTQQQHLSIRRHENRAETCPNKKTGKHCGWHPLYITVADTGIGI